jgi:hypothetical protein
MGAATAETLSEHLLAEAKRFMGYPELVGRGKANKWAGTVWNETILPVSVEGLEWIAPKPLNMRRVPAMLNEYYSKRLLVEVPSIVARALTLSPLEGTKSVPRQVSVYLEQSSKSYVAGLWDGAVALARACLEEMMEDRIGRLIGRQQRDLKEWIDEAERKRLLNRDQSVRARVVQVAGNEVLHQKSATEGEALQVIQELRVLVSELYR